MQSLNRTDGFDFSRFLPKPLTREQRIQHIQNQLAAAQHLRAFFAEQLDLYVIPEEAPPILERDIRNLGIRAKHFGNVLGGLKSAEVKQNG